MGVEFHRARRAHQNPLHEVERRSRLGQAAASSGDRRYAATVRGTFNVRRSIGRNPGAPSDDRYPQHST